MDGETQIQNKNLANKDIDSKLKGDAQRDLKAMKWTRSWLFLDMMIRNLPILPLVIAIPSIKIVNTFLESICDLWVDKFYKFSVSQFKYQRTGREIYNLKREIKSGANNGD